jgi:Uma2 family endonuclease
VAEEVLLLGQRHRISVDLYDRITESGLLTKDDPVELLEGLLVEKMSKNPPHVVATALLEKKLHRVVPDNWFVTSGNPIKVPERDSEPEPDTQIVRGDPREYNARKPGPADVALVIEVSDTSYALDRRIKWTIYGAGGVPVYWLLDLNRRVLEVHTDPSPDGYRTLHTLGPDEEIALVLDGREVARFPVREVLP